MKAWATNTELENPKACYFLEDELVKNIFQWAVVSLLPSTMRKDNGNNSKI